MRVVVYPADGYIGTNVAQHFAAAGHDVVRCGAIEAAALQAEALGADMVVCALHGHEAAATRAVQAMAKRVRRRG